MKQLSSETVKLITSSKVITSLVTIVKELTENALDVGSTKIDVKLIGFGLEKIEVQDNGCGVNASDISYMCLPYYTSKVSSFDDLKCLTTYGFRGEALYSLCALANVVVTTKTSDDITAKTYKFLQSGKVDDALTKPTAGRDGTCVTVTNLFQNIPVRRTYYKNEKKLKEELKCIELLLMSFGIAYPQVRLALYHNQQLIFLKQNFDNVKNVLRLIWGNACMNQMKYTNINNASEEVQIECFLPVILSATCQDKAPFVSDKKFVIINKRPVLMKEIDKIITKKLSDVIGTTRSVCYCLIINVASCKVDVNVEPNKTRVLLHQKELIFSLLEKILEDNYLTVIENDAETTSNNAKTTEKNNHKVTSDKNKGLHLPKINSPSKRVNDSRATDFPTLESTDNVESPDSFDIDSLFETRSRISNDDNNQNRTRNLIEDESEIFDTGSIEPSPIVTSDIRTVNITNESWKRGTLKDKSNNIIQPVQLLFPNAKRSHPSPVKIANAKKKCIGTEKTHSHSEKRSAIAVEPSTPYMMFAHEVRKQVIDENPGIQFNEVGKVIHKKWQQLDKNVKNTYKEASFKEKPRKALNYRRPSVIPQEFTKMNTKSKERNVSPFRMINVNFDIKKLKTDIEKIPWRRKEPLHLIGNLKDGPWFIRIGNEIGTLNHLRAKEIELYHNLLEKHSLPPKRLDFPLTLTESLVGGNRQWSTLLNLKNDVDTSVYHIITDPRLLANGIKVMKWKDPNTNLFHANIIGMTDCLKFYGVNDLKEILAKLIQDEDLSLDKCRPLKVINYFKAEAIRLSRQLPLEMNSSEVLSCVSYLLEKNVDLCKYQCLHGNRIFELIYDITTIDSDVNDVGWVRE